MKRENVNQQLTRSDLLRWMPRCLLTTAAGAGIIVLVTVACAGRDENNAFSRAKKWIGCYEIDPPPSEPPEFHGVRFRMYLDTTLSYPGAKDSPPAHTDTIFLVRPEGMPVAQATWLVGRFDSLEIRIRGIESQHILKLGRGIGNALSGTVRDGDVYGDTSKPISVFGRTVSVGRAECELPVQPGATFPRPGVRFNPEITKPGAQIGALVLDSLDAQLAAVDSVWVGIARFKGELTLKGRTLRHFDSDWRAVCFEADSASAARMPRWEGDDRRPWFCFENTDVATRTLAPLGEERDATIVIDRFVIHRGMSDQVNSARLVRVVPTMTAPGSSAPPAPSHTQSRPGATNGHNTEISGCFRSIRNQSVAVLHIVRFQT